jgi:hypothetical protein
MKEPDWRVHHILYGFQGFMLIARDDLLAQAGLKGAPATWTDMLAYAKKAQQPPRSFGLGIPVSNQTDSNVWEDVMKSHGARLADEAGKRVVLGDHKREVWEFLDYFTELKANVFPRGHDLGQHHQQLHLPGGQAVFVLNQSRSLWLEATTELLAKTALHLPAAPLIQPVNYGSRSILRSPRRRPVRSSSCGTVQSARWTASTASASGVQCSSPTWPSTSGRRSPS